MSGDDFGKAPGQERSHKEAELRSLLDRGIAAAQRGQRDRARRYLERALALDGSNEEAWLWLASITEDRGLAAAIYERLLEVYPDSTQARQALIALNEAGAMGEEPEPVELEASEAPLEPGPIEAPQGEMLEEEEVSTSVSGEEDGPSLFVPPWEVDATIPVLGKAATPPPLAREAEERREENEDVEPLDDEVLPEQVVQNHVIVHGSGSEETSQPSGAETIEKDIGGEIAPPAALEEPAGGEEPVSESVFRSQEPALEASVELKPPSDQTISTVYSGIEEPSHEETQDIMDPLPPHKEADSTAVPPTELLRNGAMFVMLLFVLIGSLLLIFLVASESRADRLRYALGMVTNTPTVTLTPTCTFTPVPTSTPSSTPTLTPSPTSTCTATSIPSATPTPSWLSERYLPLPEEEKWIEVDLSDQTLTAYDGTVVVYTAIISSGKGYTPTVKGKFRIMRKLESQLMTGAGFYLPNVPHVMYFYARYALHGAYWHDKWGTPTSHGCVNLKLEDAKWLYAWADPKVPAGAKIVSASKENPGTWVLIHD